MRVPFLLHSFAGCYLVFLYYDYFKAEDLIKELMSKLDNQSNKKLIEEKGLRYLVERFKERAKREIGEIKLQCYGMTLKALRYIISIFFNSNIVYIHNGV
jgi:hypothetical protein